MMVAIEALSVDPVNVPHAHREIAINRFHKQVVVIGHQAISIATPIKAPYRLLDQIKETRPVSIIFKYRHPGVSPHRHMINGPRIFNAQWPCHNHNHTLPNIILQDLTPTSRCVGSYINSLLTTEPSE
jgi:hypothetical protein